MSRNYPRAPRTQPRRFVSVAVPNVYGDGIAPLEGAQRLADYRHEFSFRYLDPTGLLLGVIDRFARLGTEGTGDNKKLVCRTPLLSEQLNARGHVVASRWLHEKPEGEAFPLYRLPELVARKDPTPLAIAEGEKDVERLRALGLVATTNPFGAKNWLQLHTKTLLRLTTSATPILILPDHDAPGRYWLETLFAVLHNRSLRIIHAR